MAARYELSPLVQKALRERNLTAEDVIRKALEIKPDGFDAGKGVVLPEGTALLAWYKDRAHWGVVRDGAIIVDDDPKESFASLSSAAAKITGRPTTNGWDFWLVKLAGKTEFVPIKST